MSLVGNRPYRATDRKELTVSAKSLIARGLVLAALVVSVAVAGAQAGTLPPQPISTLTTSLIGKSLLPDLVLTNVGGGRVRVSNQGLGAAGAFQISAENLAHGEPTGAQSFSIPGLGAGESFTFANTRCLLSVDSGHAVAELNEQNNTLSVANGICTVV